MITKLLLTLGVIAIAWLVLRNRVRQSEELNTRQQTASLSPPVSKVSHKTPRLAAYGLVLFMLGASGIFLYLQWRDEYRIVTVQVINTQTGQTDAALELLGRAIQRNYLEGYYYRAAVWQQIGEREKAIRDLETYLEARPAGLVSAWAQTLLDELQAT